MMLSVKEVAELLGIRPHGVLQLIHTGQITAADVSLHPGGKPRWRVSRGEAEEFVRRRTKSPTPKRRRRRRQAPDIKQYF